MPSGLRVSLTPPQFLRSGILLNVGCVATAIEPLICEWGEPPLFESKSYGSSSSLSVAVGVFGGEDAFVAGFFARGAFAGAAASVEGVLVSAVVPTAKYLRILSSRFGPMPRMACNSSTLLNVP